MFPSGYFLSLSGKLLLRVACTFSLPFGTSHGVQISLCNVGISAPPPPALASSKGISAPGAVSDIPCMSSPQGTRGSWVPSRGFEEGPLAPSHTSSLEPQSSRTCAQFPEPPPSAPAFAFPTPPPPNWAARQARPLCDARTQPVTLLSSGFQYLSFRKCAERPAILTVSQTSILPKAFHSHQNVDCHISKGPSCQGSVPLLRDDCQRINLSGLSSSQKALCLIRTSTEGALVNASVFLILI